MSLDSCQGVLDTAYSEFSRQWHASGDFWLDAKREEFDAAYMANLDARVRAASAAMAELSELIRRVKQDCA